MSLPIITEEHNYKDVEEALRGGSTIYLEATTDPACDVVYATLTHNAAHDKFEYTFPGICGRHEAAHGNRRGGCVAWLSEPFIKQFDKVEEAAFYLAFVGSEWTP